MCPLKVAIGVAGDPSGFTRHNIAVLSAEQVAKRGAVGWNDTDQINLLCPLKVAKGVCSADPSGLTRHNIAVLSPVQVASMGNVG